MINYIKTFDNLQLPTCYIYKRSIIKYNIFTSDLIASCLLRLKYNYKFTISFNVIIFLYLLKKILCIIDAKMGVVISFIKVSFNNFYNSNIVFKILKIFFFCFFSQSVFNKIHMYKNRNYIIFTKL